VGLQWDKNGEAKENSWQTNLVILRVYSKFFVQTSWSLRVRNDIGIDLETMARVGLGKMGRHHRQRLHVPRAQQEAMVAIENYKKLIPPKTIAELEMVEVDVHLERALVNEEEVDVKFTN